MLFLRALPLTLCSIAITGCAWSPYVVPEGEPIAKLRYIDDSPHITSLKRFNLASCASTPHLEEVAHTDSVSAIPFSSTKEVSNVEMIGTNPDGEHNIRERLIGVSDLFLFEVGFNQDYLTSGIRNSCYVVGLIQLQEDYQYELKYDADGTSCSVAIHSLSLSDSGDLIRKPERFRQYTGRRIYREICDWVDGFDND